MKFTIGALSSIRARFGALGGLAGTALGTSIPGLIGYGVAQSIMDALLQGVGLSTTVKRTVFNIPYGISFTAM